jgi:hypothetical protein
LHWHVGFVPIAPEGMEPWLGCIAHRKVGPFRDPAIYA